MGAVANPALSILSAVDDAPPPGSIAVPGTGSQAQLDVCAVRPGPTPSASGGSPQAWEYVHIAIDDCTRLAYAEVLSDEKGTTAVAFLSRETAFHARYNITVRAVMTDNGSPCVSALHAVACRCLRIKHTGWLWHYNHLRRHSALGHHPPVTRVTNLLGTYV